MIYELRIYHILPGRMGAIEKRFRDHTLKIFPRHGINVQSFWRDVEGREKLYYVCEFEDEAAKDAAWASFKGDPEWERVKTESEKDGPIVERIESYLMESAPL